MQVFRADVVMQDPTPLRTIKDNKDTHCNIYYSHLDEREGTLRKTWRGQGLGIREVVRFVGGNSG